MALRARKVSGTFEKRAPGTKSFEGICRTPANWRKKKKENGRTGGGKASFFCSRSSLHWARMRKKRERERLLDGCQFKILLFNFFCFK